MTKNIGILGATGYAALELIKILLRHPEVEVVTLTSRQEGSPHVGMVHPQLAGRLDLRLENLDPIAVAARCDCVFGCLPHKASADVVPSLLDAGTRVVDFSADYRLNDPDTYAKWYGQKHPNCSPRRSFRPTWLPIRAVIRRRPSWLWLRCFGPG